MDVNALAASLQALMDAQKAKAAATPQPVQSAPVADVLVASEPESTPDAFFEHLFAPAAEDTSADDFDGPSPYFDFDDHLLDETEETGDVKVNNVANAKYRATRTGYQGLIASVLIAVGGVLTSLQLDAEINWKLIGISVGQAVLTAVVSFLHNDKSAAASE
ncbi:hypothetical protein [Nonomuraea candida]|uniref:hypothetical protein n=1 Tax=Nonomuraea candida TaxID=359159 RepID=UPI0005BA1E07|nr:hypothetical protein [Nonomuraea candida]